MQCILGWWPLLGGRQGPRSWDYHRCCCERGVVLHPWIGLQTALLLLSGFKSIMNHNTVDLLQSFVALSPCMFPMICTLSVPPDDWWPCRENQTHTSSLCGLRIIWLFFFFRWLSMFAEVSLSRHRDAACWAIWANVSSKDICLVSVPAGSLLPLTQLTIF